MKICTYCAERGIKTKIIVACLLLILLAACIAQPLESEEHKTFNDVNLGVTFEYPSSMVYEKSSGSVNIDDKLGTAYFIEFLDTINSTMIGIEIVDRSLVFQKTYYPSLSTKEWLQLVGEAGLSQMEIQQSASNTRSISNAMKNGVMVSIDEYTGLSYNLTLTDNKLGSLYIKGIEGQTEKRSIRITVVGIVGNTEGNVTVEMVDNIWGRLISTLTIKD
jgi:hypothetical protein